MKAQDFRGWMQRMGFRKASEVVRCLDVSRNLAQQWVAAAEAGEDLAIKRTVALAMAAAANDLEPWGEPKG